MEYELLFFISFANEERVGEIKKEIEEAIVKFGGEISADFSDVGKRKLAYPVKKQTHAFFSFCRFTLEETDNLPELNRRLNLNDKIMRHLIVRADEVGKPFAAQMERETKPEAREQKIARPKTEEKPAEVETKVKVEMAKLDEKLDEILENPE